MSISKLVKSQYKELEKKVHGKLFRVKIRYDDQGGNGHNTFAITGSYDSACGCIHELIAEHFPPLKKYIKWHLCSRTGPLHYIENTLYLATNTNLKNARSTAIWPKATLRQLRDKSALKARLPKLIERFKKDMESLGFTF